MLVLFVQLVVAFALLLGWSPQMRSQSFAANPSGTKAISPNAVGFNVRHFGALADGASDDTIAFERALTAAGNYGTVFVPAGTYLINLNLAGKRVTIQGAGMNATILQPYSSAEAAITLGFNNGWLAGELRDLQVGGPSGTRTHVGVSFGSPTEQGGDEYAGRMIFTKVYFIDLDVCVFKRYGNIGVRYDHCLFENANYHQFAESHASGDPMHAGCDLVYGCHLSGAQKASFYYDSAVDGTGQVVFKGCIWEGNPGFLLFVWNFANTGIGANVQVEDCWNESNYTAGSVTIEGSSYTAGFAYLRNCFSASIERTTIGPITLVNAVLGTRDCVTDNLTLSKDSDSAYFAEDVNADATAPNGFTLSLKRSARDTGNLASIFVVPQRTKVSAAYGHAFVSTFTGEVPISFTGTNSLTSTTAADGLLFDAAQDLTFTAPSQVEQMGGGAGWNVTEGKWLVFTAELKKVSGDDPTSFDISGGGALFRSWLSPFSTSWQTFAGLAKVASSVSGDWFRVTGPASGTGVVRFGAVQVLQFDTLQEALEFLESRVFYYSAKQRELIGSAAPTTGTWRVGDRVWNTAPAAAGTMGWVCTTAGTPGTWKTFGAIAA